VGVINADSIVRSGPVTNVGNLLTGRVPGVQVSMGDGQAGESAKIRVRGLNSFTVSNDPVLIVDGVRVDGTPSQSNIVTTQFPGVFGGGSPGYVRSGRMGDFSPADIESIEVVKGASATTLYGTDAANGVILITTKQGRTGGARWTVLAERGMSQLPNTARYSYYGWGHTPAGAIVQCDLQGIAGGTCVQDSITKWSPFHNPDTSPFANGPRTEIGAQVAGGVAQFRYFLSGSYSDETGPFKMPAADVRYLVAQRAVSASDIPDWQMKPNTASRLSLRFNASANLNPSTDVSLGSNVIVNNNRSIRSSALQSALEGFNTGYRDANDGWSVSATAATRPASVFAQKTAESVVRYVGTAGVNWRPRSWLAGSGSFGLDFYAKSVDFLTRAGEGTSSPAAATGNRTLDNVDEVLYSVDLKGTATAQPFTAVESRTTLGTHLARSGQYLDRASATGLPLGSESVVGAATPSVSEATEEKVTAGVYVEEHGSWRDRVFVTPSLRLDGGSGFGHKFTTSLFTNLNVSWVVSSEPWMPRLPGVNSLRLRAASGTSAVQAPATASLPTVTASAGLVDGAQVSAITGNQIGNNTLKPERQQETEWGADLELWHGRATIEATGYTKLSHDALVLRTVAGSVGTPTTRYENVGAVANWGWESSLTSRLLDRPTTSFDVTVSGSFTQNKLVSAGTAVARIATGTGALVEGYPLYTLWQRPILGYNDANADGILTYPEVQVGSAPVYQGPADPTRQISVSGLLGLLGGRVRLNSLVDYRGGNARLITNQCQIKSTEACQEAVDRTVPLDQQASGVANYNPATLSFYGYVARKAQYARLREISATVKLGGAVLRASGARDGELTVAGRNLFTWTSFKGAVDPESSQSAGADYSATFSVGAFPVARSALLRLTLNY
jgi:TonB-dependent SusC/RagA subfamily outer membrane receptor